MPGGFNPPQDIIDSWPEPNFTDPETRKTELTAGIITVTVASVIVLLLRLYSRVIVMRSTGLDDIFILIAEALGIALTVVVIIGLQQYGWSMHVWDQRPGNLEKSFMFEWIAEQIRMPCLYMIKVSILLFYKRILSRLSSKKFNMIINGSIIYIVITSFLFAMLYFFRCVPPFAYWQRHALDPLTDSQFTCNVDEGLVNVLSTVNCTLTNFLVTTIPLFFIGHLKIRQAQKIEFGILISLGYLVCITSVIRLAYVIIIHYRSYDVYWYYGWSWTWMLVEIHIGIMVASAPALKPLYSRVLPTSSTFSSFFREKFSSASSRPSWYRSNSEKSTASTSTSISSKSGKSGQSEKLPENSIHSTTTFGVSISHV